LALDSEQPESARVEGKEGGRAGLRVCESAAKTGWGLHDEVVRTCGLGARKMTAMQRLNSVKAP
jgi:hypothetical protein